MEDRRRFYLVGGRTIFVDQTPAGRTRLHVAFGADGDGVFWPVCGNPVGEVEREVVSVGVFEELRREATCLKCRRTREPMLPRQVRGARGPRRRWS